MNYKKYIAEMLGTFILVFCGTGAIIVNHITGGEVVTHLGVALVFGLVVLAMIYTIGDISGAHINPAVTLAFWSAGRFPKNELLPYITSQIAGAILASIFLKIIFMGTPTLGETIPSGTYLQSFVLEMMLTFFLMFVIINVSSGAKEKGIIAGIAVGCVVGLEALFAGPITGASMNPARSIGPALLNGNLESLWIYIVAPIVGAYLAILACCIVKDKDCCSGSLCFSSDKK